MNTDFKSIFILLIILSIPVLIYLIPLFIKSYEKERRKKEFSDYVRKTKSTSKSYFSRAIKDCSSMDCFYSMLDPTFCNVIERLDKENGDLYIGDLEWEISVPVNKRRRHRGLIGSLLASNSGSEGHYRRVKYNTTFCIFYDDGFNLPNFELSKETLGKKTTELLRMNSSEDIDFDEDKEFSSAWWLTSNENMVVKNLFTKSIRSGFMNYVNKGYKICGQKNFIFIMTDKLVSIKNTYSDIVSDMRSITRFMKTNKKFYTPYSERQLENIEQ